MNYIIVILNKEIEMTLTKQEVVSAIECFMHDYIETDDEMENITTSSEMVDFALDDDDIVAGIAEAFDVDNDAIYDLFI